MIGTILKYMIVAMVAVVGTQLVSMIYFADKWDQNHRNGNYPFEDR